MKKREREIVMGEFNSLVVEGSTDKVVGPFGLGRRNERGKILIDFCKYYYQRIYRSSIFSLTQIFQFNT